MMSPWDAYRWFDTPTETFFADPGVAGNQRIVSLDVRRVYLMIRPGGAQATCQVSMHADATGMSGFLIDRAAPLELAQQNSGPLCQSEWWQIAGGGAVTVIEVKLRDWPHTMEGPPDGA